jgi:hypothetical protein
MGFKISITVMKHVEWSCNKIKILVLPLVGHFVCIYAQKKMHGTMNLKLKLQLLKESKFKNYKSPAMIKARQIWSKYKV